APPSHGRRHGLAHALTERSPSGRDTGRAGITSTQRPHRRRPSSPLWSTDRFATERSGPPPLAPHAGRRLPPGSPLRRLDPSPGAGHEPPRPPRAPLPTTPPPAGPHRGSPPPGAGPGHPPPPRP